MILSKLEGQAKAGQYGRGASARYGTEEDTLQARVMEMLDRVQIMRAFDLDGVLEALSEVRELLEQTEYIDDRDPLKSLATSQDPGGKTQEERQGNAPSEESRQHEKPKIKKMEIADSEEEDDDEDEDEDHREQEKNTIDQAATQDLEPDALALHVRTMPPAVLPQAAGAACANMGQAPSTPTVKVGMIVLDTITSVISPLMRVNQVQGM